MFYLNIGLFCLLRNKCCAKGKFIHLKHAVTLLTLNAARGGFKVEEIALNRIRPLI